MALPQKTPVKNNIYCNADSQQNFLQYSNQLHVNKNITNQVAGQTVQI